MATATNSSSPKRSIASSDHLRLVESLSQFPSGAGKIPRLNAVVLGESIASEEDDLVFPSDDFCRQALVSSPKQYLEMYKKSIEDPAGFWSEIASQFYWKEKWSPELYTENLDVTKGPIKIEWFKGASTNISYNALDRNIEAGNGDKIALYWEGNEPGYDGKLTYSELLEKVCQLANYLKNVGVKKGDAVVIYLPMLMELPIAMLACARIGAVHSVVFAGFSAESLAQRIIDCKPKVVITCNAVCRGVKAIHLKDIVDSALVESAKSGVPVGSLDLPLKRKLPVSAQLYEAKKRLLSATGENCSSLCRASSVPVVLPASPSVAVADHVFQRTYTRRRSITAEDQIFSDFRAS